MTEITVDMRPLPPAIERFVLHWGEMGSVWGVNRSVSQIHALLYVADQPLTAEDIAERLGIARSNVSNSLKELLGWQLIRRVHVMGDRRDYFEAEVDLFEMVRRIAQGRKQREIDPTLDVLRACVADARADRSVSAAARAKLDGMLELVGTVDRSFSELMRLPASTLMALLRMGGAIGRMVTGRSHKPKDR
jgi:DNA-binding transcriptional regulator GbsR (MarR family)